MSKSKFITKVQELFGLEPHSDESKKVAIKELMYKLKAKRIVLKQEMKCETDIIKRETLKDSIKIIKKQIKKAEEILNE
ncbi:MAG: hypothetical protein PHN18_09940 [Sulfurospirillaceae bacterium]|jgi:hypothetical protein|nr:hypothetical protein [Sulfurospirillaceae bacterium]MDD2827034.1 hypothetical protein [Sulfurospirillaceae bacterium]